MMFAPLSEDTLATALTRVPGATTLLIAAGLEATAEAILNPVDPVSGAPIATPLGGVLTLEVTAGFKPGEWEVR